MRRIDRRCGSRSAGRSTSKRSAPRSKSRAWAFLEEIERVGGFIEALDRGWVHARASENQFVEAEAIESGLQQVIGVNVHRDDMSPYEVDGFAEGVDAWEQGMGRLKQLHADAIRRMP